MDFIYGVFAILSLISFIFAIVGLIKPKWVTFGKFPTAKRLKVFGVYFVIMIGATIGTSIFTTPERAAINAQHKQERQLKQQQADKVKEAEAQQKLQDKKEKEQKQYVDIIKNATGATDEQSKQIYSIFQSIAVSQIKSMLLIDKEHSAYQWEATELGKNGIAVIYIPDGVVSKIVFKNNVIYENGNITGKLSDEILSSSECEMAEDYAVKAVTERLKAPKSAEFDKGHFQYSKHNNIITVTGKVDAQNSFGAMLRNKFVVEINQNQNTYTLVALE